MTAPAVPISTSDCPAGLSARIVLRQASSPAKVVLAGGAVEAAQLRPDAVGADEQEAGGRRGAAGDIDRHGDAMWMKDRIADMGAGDQLDSGLAGDMREKGALQVGAIAGEVGRIPAPLRRPSEWHAREFGETRCIAQDDGFGPDGGRAQPRQYAKPVEDPRCVGRELDARASLFEPRGAFEDTHRKATYGERQCCG